MTWGYLLTQLLTKAEDFAPALVTKGAFWELEDTEVIRVKTTWFVFGCRFKDSQILLYFICNLINITTTTTTNLVFSRSEKCLNFSLNA